MPGKYNNIYKQAKIVRGGCGMRKRFLSGLIIGVMAMEMLNIDAVAAAGITAIVAIWTVVMLIVLIVGLINETGTTTVIGPYVVM